MGHNSEITFTVTIFGSGVFQNNLIEGYILDTTDESLNKVKSHIENKYNISSYRICRNNFTFFLDVFKNEK